MGSSVARNLVFLCFCALAACEAPQERARYDARRPILELWQSESGARVLSAINRFAESVDASGDGDFALTVEECEGVHTLFNAVAPQIDRAIRNIDSLSSFELRQRRLQEMIIFLESEPRYRGSVDDNAHAFMNHYDVEFCTRESAARRGFRVYRPTERSHPPSTDATL